MFLKKMQSRQSPNKPPIFLWALSFAFIKVHFKHHLINRDPQRPYWTYLCSFAPELSQSRSQMPEICNSCRKIIMIYDKKIYHMCNPCRKRGAFVNKMPHCLRFLPSLQSISTLVLWNKIWLLYVFLCPSISNWRVSIGHYIVCEFKMISYRHIAG